LRLVGDDRLVHGSPLFLIGSCGIKPRASIPVKSSPK
jgi:hypothetical protein